MENEVVYLYLDDIIPNRFQPRENFDEQAMRELAVSIREHGVIQPIVVRKQGEKYEIIAGERRYKATTMAGLTRIPAIIKNLDDKESSKVALIENLQRKDLTPIEEARTYQKILELDALTQEELAKTMGKSQSAVSNKLRLLSLTDEVQDALLKEKVSERHARTLLNIENPKMQVELLNKVITNRMTVRELDEEVKRMNISVENPNVNNNNFLDYNKPVGNAIEELNNTPREVESLFDNDRAKNNDEFIIKPIDNLNKNVESIINNPNNVIGGTGLLAGKPVDIINTNRETIPDVVEPAVVPTKGIDIQQKPIAFNNASTKMKASQTIENVRNTIKQIKEIGSKIESEEFDFEDFYQFVIRVDKSN